jgi:hypothetical protein
MTEFRPAPRLVAIVFGFALCTAPTLSFASAASQAAIRAHAEFLADDLLEGREAGTRGFEVAARYAATRFAQYGLDPGADGGFLQRVPFRKTQLLESSVEIAGRDGRTALIYKEDYLFSARGAHPRFELSAPIVFVGHGIDAPDLGHRDYEGVDVEGKIVMLVSGAPESFPSTQRAHHSSRRLKAALASRRGALGIVSLRSRVDARRVGWDRIARNAGRPGFQWVHPDGRPETSDPGLRFSLLLSDEGLGKLFAGSGTSADALLDEIEAGNGVARDLPLTLHVGAESSQSDAGSPNVVGILRGADSELAGQFVVVSAHLDHTGIGAEVDGDTIYNGFFDNAIGSAIVLEAARVLAEGEAPRRSIVFLLVTAEEKGLLGSSYFNAYPTLPREAIVANVNIDMPKLLAPLADLIALGAEHSSLGPLAERAATDNGFELSPDPAPEEVRFVRSDQYSFVRSGIPAINLIAGESTLGGGDTQLLLSAEFIKEHYHRPSDEPSLGADWDSVVRYAGANVDLLRAIAAADLAPSWNDGDFFGGLFSGDGP